MSAKTGKDTVRINAATLAVLIADPIGSHDLALGRKWRSPSDGAKRVRSVARDTVDRFVNRTGYTAHDYTVDEARAIVTAMREHGRGQGTVDADAARAAIGVQTPPKTRKATRKARKAREDATAAQDAAQDATDGAA